MRFVKGHGTGNDFVLLPDPDGRLELTPDRVRRVTDRHTGIGGDGVIRVVPSHLADEPEIRAIAGRAGWFMDYRNADGSLAQMCGNGARVFAAFLDHEGWQTASRYEIATRSGPKRVWTVGTGYAVDLGAWSRPGRHTCDGRSFDCVVRWHGGPELPGLRIDVGNPHVVVALPEDLPLRAVDLDVEPSVTPAVAEGCNVEFVKPVAPGRIAIRVHERGVGETLSCGTGAAAAAMATRWWQGESAGNEQWAVELPGGVLTVTAAQDGTVHLAGPAMLVADGVTSL